MKKIQGLVILILSIVFVMTACNRSKTGNTSVQTVGEVIYFEGTVMVNNAVVTIGDAVHNGDRVTTSAGSYVEITFGDHSVLRAQENTSLVFNSSEQTLEMNSGALGVVQSKARFLSRDKPWNIRTPTAIAAVRGTVYYVKVEDPDTTYFCLCNGRIDLTGIDKNDTVALDASHHQAARFIRSENGIIHEEAPMLFHSDEDMESLADRVNVSIDWDSIP